MTARKHAELIKQMADDDLLELEWYSPTTCEWLPCTEPFNIIKLPDLEYRIKLTKPSIDWSHVAENLNWLAIDENGSGYLFENKPHISGNLWTEHDGECTDSIYFTSFKRGTCDWKESLVQRPEGE